MNTSRNRSGSASKVDERKARLKSASSKSSANVKNNSRSNSENRTEKSAAKHRSLSKKSKSSYDSTSDDDRKSKHSASSKKSKSSKVSKISEKSKKKSKDKSKKHSSKKSSKDVEEPKIVPTDIEDLRNQGLATLSISIFQKTNLKQLLISGNNIRSLPTAMKDLVNLEYLDVSKNPLKIKDENDSNCFPLEMRLMKNLKNLNISECNLRYLPSVIWLMPTIEQLNISRNKIGLVVPEIGNLTNLTSLNMSQCDLRTIPAEIGFCVELIEIILWGNEIEFLPETLKECVKLRELKMSYRSFYALLGSYMENLIRKGQIKSEHIPLVIFDLIDLRILDLNATQINNLPENNLKNLEELYLNNNYFEHVPETIFQAMYQTLKVLKLESNQLTQVPHEMKLLENLELLNLNSNKISIFPNFEINLFNLTELYLSKNQIHELTSDIGLLKNLRKLTLDSNKLQTLPETLYNLVYLEYLDISNNKIVKLSNKICRLKSLRCAHSYKKLNKVGLWLIGNPLLLPPQNIWKTTNIEKIFNFLTTYYNRDINFIYYSKLVFIGDTGSGKSIVIDCLLNPLNIRNILNASSGVLAASTLSFSNISLKKMTISNSNLKPVGKTAPLLPTTGKRATAQGNLVNFVSTPLDTINQYSHTPMGIHRNSSNLEANISGNEILHTNSRGTATGNPVGVAASGVVAGSGDGISTALNIVENIHNFRAGTNLQIHESSDNTTHIARKLYLRTKDKYEFGILDLGGEQTYHHLYPLFLSSIDFLNEPTIFVVVYSHSEYTTLLHDQLIGNWLKYLFLYTNVDDTESGTPSNTSSTSPTSILKIKIKLVGIKSDLISDIDDDYYDVTNKSLNETKKKSEIIDNCYQTINLYKKQLLKERNRLESILTQYYQQKQQNNQDYDYDENFNSLKTSINLINKHLNKEFEFINNDILIIKSETLRSDITSLLNELQGEAKLFNKCAPIQFRDQVKKYLLKSDRKCYKLELNEFVQKLNEVKKNFFTEDEFDELSEIPELNSILNDNETILHYLNIIMDIFWFKLNPKYCNYIYHRLGFLIECMQTIVTHDLEFKLDYNKNRLYKQIGLYYDQDAFLNEFKLVKSYGIFTQKIIDALVFLLDFNSTDYENYLQLLQEFLIAYRSDYNVVESHQPAVKIVIPSMCSNRFKKIDQEVNQKKENLDKTVSTKSVRTSNTENATVTDKVQTTTNITQSDNENDNTVDVIDDGKEENYFLKLDKIREFENIMKLIKAERKEKAIWDLNQYTYENEDEEEEKVQQEQRRSALSAKLRETINIIPSSKHQQDDKIIKEETEEEVEKAIKQINGGNNKTISNDTTDEATKTWNEITTNVHEISNHDYMRSFADEFKYIKNYNDVEIDETPFQYKHQYHINLIFPIDNQTDISHVFYKLSILIQDFVYERLDSNDCVIARDSDNNFIKIEFIKKYSPISQANATTSDNANASATSGGRMSSANMMMVTMTSPSLMQTLHYYNELNCNKIIIDVKSIDIESIEHYRALFNDFLKIALSFYPAIPCIKQAQIVNL